MMSHESAGEHVNKKFDTRRHEHVKVLEATGLQLACYGCKEIMGLLHSS